MPTWLTIVLALGGSTLISLIITGAWHSMENKLKHIQDLERINKEAREREEDIVRQQQWQNQVVEIIEPVVGKIDEIKEQLDLDKKATVTSLRSNMKSLLDHYRQQGYADSSDKAVWNELYNNYKCLGGNHFKEYVDQWKSEVDDLPKEQQNKN